ncbi:hypothetical protein [Bauldia litoralis]|uniref:Uncharacterized protein n=1 Tax=Bauldia litoralis TaxID=665467 RepID=A0A1G6CQN3_9HYPH|nr:hypothetical protein [Bauldia litoralis]SDB35201.1 hypothetical protein SAMN02982931_02620 [Bauldia litoralis]
MKAMGATIKNTLLAGFAGWSFVLSAGSVVSAPANLYQSCIDRLKTEQGDAFCGGLVKGYELGYAARSAVGLGDVPWSGTSSGLVFGPQGFAGDSDQPLVFQPAGAGSEPFVLEPAPDEAEDQTTVGKGPYTFDIEKFKTVPLETWLSDNPGKFDPDRFKALQGAVGEFGADKPVIYQIPGPS